MAHLEQIQHDLMTNVEVEAIPHGTSVDLNLIDYYLRTLGLPGSFAIDLGTGQGQTAKKLCEKGYGVLAIDSNPNAIREARKHTLFAFEGDATTFDLKGVSIEPMLHEFYGGVIMQGLLCNLIGDQWRKALYRSREALVDHGFFFVSDVLRADEYNPNIEAHLGSSNYGTWVADWIYRYCVNSEALSLPFGTFAVAKPGPNKDYEWGTVEEIRRLSRSEHLERYARHFTVAELSHEMEYLGMKEKIIRREIWHSRTGLPLSGFVGIWQKQ